MNCLAKINLAPLCKTPIFVRFAAKDKEIWLGRSCHADVTGVKCEFWRQVATGETMWHFRSFYRIQVAQRCYWKKSIFVASYARSHKNAQPFLVNTRALQAYHIIKESKNQMQNTNLLVKWIQYTSVIKEQFCFFTAIKQNSTVEPAWLWPRGLQFIESVLKHNRNN